MKKENLKKGMEVTIRSDFNQKMINKSNEDFLNYSNRWEDEERLMCAGKKLCIRNLEDKFLCCTISGSHALYFPYEAI